MSRIARGPRDGIDVRAIRQQQPPRLQRPALVSRKERQAVQGSRSSAALKKLRDMCMQRYRNTRIHVHFYVCTYVYMYTSVCKSEITYIYTYVCIHIYMCVYI